MQCTDITEAFRSRLIVAKPYIHAKNELLLDPTLFDKMLETRSLKYTFRDNLDVISNADTFINYLESISFDKLLDAGESVEKDVSIISSLIMDNSIYIVGIVSPYNMQNICGSLEIIATCL